MLKNYDLIIEQATCLLPDSNASFGLKQDVADIAILGGKIAAIEPRIKASAQQTIQAQGLHLLPGLIDTQVHFREPGMTHKEDLESGSRSAVMGGITALFEMPNTVPATTTEEALNDKIKRAQGRSWTNFAFYVGGSSANAHELAKLEQLPGCCGIKVFMGSSTGTLLVEDDEVLDLIFKNGQKRIALHSEDEHRLKERKHIAIEKKDVHFHHIWRDVETALISTKKLLALSEKHQRPVHVLHISTADEMSLFNKHKPRVSVEILPQHLTLSAPECYDRWGTLAQQNPPIREKYHQDVLWQAVANGTVDIMGSDHAPHLLSEKQLPYPQSPSGMTGVQTMLPIMLNHVNNKKLSLEHLTKLLCTNPAQIFKIKNKGALKVGNDADITIIDLKAQRTIENKWIQSKSGWTIYDGWKVTGWPKMTLINGQLVMSDDQLIGKPTGQVLEFL